MNLSVNWLYVINELLEGIIFGTGFMFALLFFVWLTRKSKNKKSSSKVSFLPILQILGFGFLCILFVMSHKFFIWFLALVYIACTFIAILFAEEEKLLKKELASINELEDEPLPFDIKPQVGDVVVYVDDFMPDHIEQIESIKDGYYFFASGSRSCVFEMVRLAHKNEIKAGKRDS